MAGSTMAATLAATPDSVIRRLSRSFVIVSRGSGVRTIKKSGPRGAHSHPQFNTATRADTGDIAILPAGCKYFRVGDWHGPEGHPRPDAAARMTACRLL